MLFFLLSFAALCRAAEPTLNGPEIYERMLATYERARSYEDTGEVQIRFIKPLWPDRTTVLPFTTAFVRPDAFRYEFRNLSRNADAGDRYLVWKSGDEVKSWWSIQPDVRANRPFELAIASATGVSGGSAARIVALLLPDLQWGRRMRLLEDVRFSGRTELEGASCYRLQANGPEGAPVEFWVDARTFLLRRLFETRRLDGFRTETTTIYHAPRVNEPVGPEKLRFDPGQAARPVVVSGSSRLNLVTFGFLALLFLINFLHWRLRRGSRWSYLSGAGVMFASLGAGALVALVLGRHAVEGIITVCLGTFLCVYTMWRRERSHLAEKARPRSARS